MRRAEEIPEQFRERIAAADHVIHAGDFETAETLAEIRDLATELTAVHGNVDPAGIGLPAVADVTVDDVTFVVTHGTLNHVEAAVYGHDAMVLILSDVISWSHASRSAVHPCEYSQESVTM